MKFDHLFLHLIQITHQGSNYRFETLLGKFILSQPYIE